jgi:hypothetical protein
MSNFKITIVCASCESKNIEVDLWMNQGAGLLHLKCQDCKNETHNSYDSDDLQDTINK